jgi:hypothetical protein
MHVSEEPLVTVLEQSHGGGVIALLLVYISRWCVRSWNHTRGVACAYLYWKREQGRKRVGNLGHEPGRLRWQEYEVVLLG